MNTIRLENDRYRLEFDAVSGSLRGLRDTVSEIELIAEPRLAGLCDSEEGALKCGGTYSS
jgi:hypothetical protein